MKASFYIHLLVAAIFLLGCTKEPEDFSPIQQAVIDSALTWLNLIDDGKYVVSWQIASQSFKEEVTEKQWDIGLKHMRAPFDRVQSRKVHSCQLSNYDLEMGKHKKASIEFHTTFENQNTVTEILSLQLVDGKWRVSTYYLDR